MSKQHSNPASTISAHNNAAMRQPHQSLASEVDADIDAIVAATTKGEDKGEAHSDVVTPSIVTPSSVVTTDTSSISKASSETDKKPNASTADTASNSASKASSATTTSAAAPTTPVNPPAAVKVSAESNESKPQDVAIQKKKTLAALFHRGAHAKLSRGEAIMRATTQKRVIGDRADRHWALLLIFFFVVNIAFALWHIMVFRGIAAGDIFIASPSADTSKVSDTGSAALDIPQAVKARLETFSKRNDKVIKVVDPSL